MLEKTYSRKKVTPRQLPLKYRIILVLGSTILVYLYSLFLNLIGGDNVLIDAASTLCSVIATILMALRFREQWFMWIIVYLISIIMWIARNAKNNITCQIPWVSTCISFLLCII